MTPGLLKLADEHPGTKINVIVQSTDGVSGAEDASKSAGGSVKKQLKLVGAVSLRIPAARLNSLAKLPGLTITPDAPVKVSGSAQTSGYNNNQIWPYEAGLAKAWANSGTPPTIAIVDSGIDANRADFGNGSRVLASVNLSTLSGNTFPGDGRGHGTFVAGIAAGSAPRYAGASPASNLVMLDVMDDTGVAKTSDVITACQWILDNKGKYNIRVANFSLHSLTPSNFTSDPLDKAVEKLWFSGVVVVAASGNYGLATGPSGVRYAPGNDPFVITAGAVDLGNTVGVGNDATAPWSAYGYTYDGFWKPEIGAPGRYMVGPIPAGSTLAAEKAANIVAPGYIQLSGTSFAAPAVSGAAAAVLAAHPGFTPDQVKGALMVTAKAPPNAAPNSVGVGELNAAQAAAVSNPPNPNKALDAFIVSDPLGGGSTFDASGWTAAAKASVSWDSVSWEDVSWGSAAWSAVSWESVSWESVAWSDASISGVAWNDVAWSDFSREDNAEGDANDAGGYTMDPADAAEIAADPSLAVPADLLPASVVPTTTSLP